MEFNGLLGAEDFLESYNCESRKKSRQMQPKVKQGGCYFELAELSAADLENLTVETTKKQHEKRQVQVKRL